MPSKYILILKWVGLVALIIAVIGVPIWYVNRVETQAFERGKVVGQTQCQQAAAAEAIASAEASQQTIIGEARKVEAAQAKARLKDEQNKKLQGKLDEALKLQNIPTSCVLSESATSLLRSAAEGDFDGIHDSISQRSDGGMQRNAPLLNSQPDRSS